MTMHEEGGGIARINEAAGRGGADVSDETVALLQKALGLSAQSEGAFAVTIAPLTLAWGVTSDTPRVPPQSEIDTLLPLVNDTDLHIDGNHVELETEGMGIDLGGIAKGEACNVALKIYEKHGITSALLDIGSSSIYALGTKPGGIPWRIGFRNPEAGSEASIASFTLENLALGMSGGYERFFEVDGERYIHIIDPRTGRPAESDIVSVGAVHADGAAADFWATTLFIWGKARTLEYMRGGIAIFLDDAGTLYVSESLRDGFEMQEWAEELYAVEFVPRG
jgi:thiamine biosynthesis lipoprotein